MHQIVRCRSRDLTSGRAKLPIHQAAKCGDRDCVEAIDHRQDTATTIGSTRHTVRSSRVENDALRLSGCQPRIQKVHLVVEVRNFRSRRRRSRKPTLLRYKTVGSLSDAGDWAVVTKGIDRVIASVRLRVKDRLEINVTNIGDVVQISTRRAVRRQMLKMRCVVTRRHDKFDAWMLSKHLASNFAAAVVFLCCADVDGLDAVLGHPIHSAPGFSCVDTVLQTQIAPLTETLACNARNRVAMVGSGR